MVCARPPLQRQSGLRAIQRLHLAFLVAAQHQRMLGRGHVLAPDVFELLDEPGIARDLEKPRTRCGFNPFARQWLETLAALMPNSAAIHGVARPLLPSETIPVTNLLPFFLDPIGHGRLRYCAALDAWTITCPDDAPP